jgi:hypothetical protein
VLLGVLGVGLLVKLAWIMWAPESVGTPAAQRIDRVDHCLDAPTQVEHRRAALKALLDHPVAVRADCWAPVYLPHTVRRGDVEAPRAAIARYRLQYLASVPQQEQDSITIYADRASGLAWKVMVNGVNVADNLDDWRMTWIRPLTARVPRDVAQSGALQLELVFAYDVGSGHALTPIWVGPTASLARRVAWRDAMQFMMPQACSIVLLIVGTFFMGFWLSRRQDSSHPLLGLASIAWSACNLQYVLRRADDPALEAWFNGIVIASVLWFMWFVYLFALRFASRRLRWVERSLPAYVFGMTVLALPPLGLLDEEGLAFLVANDCVAAAITLLICWLAIRGGSLELKVIAASLVLGLIAGTHDIALLANAAPPDHIYLLPYTGVPIFASFLFAVQRRYVGAINAHEES